MKPKYKVHLQRTYQKWGGTVNTTLCGRSSDVAIDTDDENVTNKRDDVTCTFCKRLFPALDRRAEREREKLGTAGDAESASGQDIQPNN